MLISAINLLSDYVPVLFIEETTNTDIEVYLNFYVYLTHIVHCIVDT